VPDSANVLVVDDSALSRAWVMRILLEQGYSVGAAADGSAAVEHVRRTEPDVLVVEDDLPGLSGRRLVEVLRTSGVCSGVVMLTDSVSDEDEREALRAGVDDVLRRPCGAEGITAAVVDAHRRGRERRARHEREHHLDAEVRAAAAIQEALIPEVPVCHGWRLDAGFLPAREVGGDCFDLFAVDQGRALLIVLADVSGKGVGAAVLAAMAQTAVRSAALRGDGPARALRAANDVLFDPLGRAGRFLTAFVARLDLVTGELAYADAGHGHAAVLTAEDELPLPAGGHPLGLLPDASYEQGIVTLRPGDRLAVFSDGLVEGEDDPTTLRDALIAAIRAGVRPEALVVEAPDADDRTMVLVERLA
jgi:sigma-B regulation protein RsbU (phosphoserine phosphatase)